MSSCVSDTATKNEEFFLDLALSSHTNRPQGPAPKGRCYNCDEPIPEGCFCDPDCRDDWEKRQQFRR